MKNYIKPEIDINNIVAIEHINSETTDEYETWLKEAELDGVTTYNIMSLLFN